MQEIFNIRDGNYNKSNHYWHSFSILEEIQKLPKEIQHNLNEKIVHISTEYTNLSKEYQLCKNNNNILLN